MSKFKFGQEVIINGILYRMKEGNKRWWARVSIEPTKVIFLGQRSLADGKMEYGSNSYEPDDNYSYFEAEKIIKGALVCEKNRNPVKVLLEDIE